jgi:hypothetical protein
MAKINYFDHGGAARQFGKGENQVKNESAYVCGPLRLESRLIVSSLRQSTGDGRLLSRRAMLRKWEVGDCAESKTAIEERTFNRAQLARYVLAASTNLFSSEATS